MPIFDHDGTTKYEIGRIADHNGTEQHKIDKIYDHDGTTMSLIYSSEETVFPPGTGFIKRSYSKNDQGSISDSELYVFVPDAADGAQCASCIIYKSVDFTGYNKLVIEWAGTFIGSYCRIGVGYTTAGGANSFSECVIGNVDLSNNRPTIIGETKTSSASGYSGTLEVDISTLSGIYEVGIAAVSRSTAGGANANGKITSIKLI